MRKKIIRAFFSSIYVGSETPVYLRRIKIKTYFIVVKIKNLDLFNLIYFVSLIN